MKKKLILLILLLLTISVGVTYAIFKWTSTNSNVTFEVEDCSITYDAGSNISGASFGPALSKDDTNNVISKKISMTPECTGVTANLTLKVGSIDDGLKDKSFIYELYDGTTKIANGNFADATTGKVYNLLNTKTLTKDTTQNYTLYIYIDGNQDNPTTMGGQSFSFTLGASGEGATKTYEPANLIETIADDTTGDTGSGVYKVSHSAITSENSGTGNTIPAITDYRYYGSTPNNYICLDMEGATTCPDRGLYRIIGSIYEENAGQNLIKVIKATPLTDGTTNTFSWDYKADGTYTNMWSGTTSGTSNGSSLMKLLNEVWINSQTTTYYNGTNSPITINFTNYGLTDTAKALMNTGKDNNKLSRYYLGGYSSSAQKINNIYLAERGKSTNTGNSLYWDGYIGLMYASDYAYAAGNTCATSTNLNAYGTSCKSKSWLHDAVLHQWTISLDTSNTYRMRYVSTSGSVNYNDASSKFRALPVFYLDKYVTITEGTGTIGDPYRPSLT